MRLNPFDTSKIDVRGGGGGAGGRQANEMVRRRLTIAEKGFQPVAILFHRLEAQHDDFKQAFAGKVVTGDAFGGHGAVEMGIDGIGQRLARGNAVKVVEGKVCAQGNLAQCEGGPWFFSRKFKRGTEAFVDHACIVRHRQSLV